MKILVVGVFNENSTNNGIANGFENAGHEVVRYDYREQARELGDKIRDQQIINAVKYTVIAPYDIVFFCKCNGVHFTVIKECSIYAKVFLWYMDPLNGNYDDELIKKIVIADYVGVAKWEVYLKAKELNPNTHFLIEGFDPKWDYPIECEKKYDVSFIGNPYGARWNWLHQVHPACFQDKYNIEHSRVVGETRININLTGGGGPSDRAYKILAAGGFLLSQDYPYMQKYGLMPGVDFAVCRTPDEMRIKCDYYLKNDSFREVIAKHGHETVQKFSRDNLAKQIIDIVK